MFKLQVACTPLPGVTAAVAIHLHSTSCHLCTDQSFKALFLTTTIPTVMSFSFSQFNEVRFRGGPIPIRNPTDVVQGLTELRQDAYRLPEGVQRIAYDADTQRYTFRDRSGRLYQSAPSEEYGVLKPVATPLSHRRNVTITGT